MLRTVLFVLIAGVLFSCSNNGVKVTYYEPHDNCEMMKIMDSSMVMGKIAFTGDVDFDLATILKAHHLGGIQMEELAIRESKDANIKKIAQRLLDEDNVQLQYLDSFFSRHTKHITKPTLPDGALKAMDKMQHTCDLQIIKDDIGHDFAILILPHRQSAVDLAEIILDECDDAILASTARQIKEKSPYQFEMLLTWLIKSRGAMK